MNRKHSTIQKIQKMLVNILSIFAVLAIALPVTQVAYAASSSPFVGHWTATDMDGSDIRLTIGGPPSGPFRITWTESYISFCDGEAGIVRGTGQLDESNPNVLEADLHLECLTTGSSLDFHLVWRYHPITGTLSSRYDNGVVIIWHRPGRPLPPPAALGLRVNYGHDWVESFYEGGHMAWITVTESDGVTVKATAELVTEPKDFWGGETGFQTRLEDWVPAPPDIQPNDWVFGWVDNGTSAQVQIGDISGMVDLENDSIEGTINAPWFSSEVEVECHSWGAPLPEEILKYDWALPNGADPYLCSWSGEWDIQSYQDVGVGYSGPDGHWVANAFIAPNPRIVASEAGDWFWVTEFYPGLLDLFIYETAEEGATLLWSGQQEATDLWGITSVGYDLHAVDLVPGNYLVVSDGVNQKGLVLETITMAVFDVENEIIAGTASPGSEVWAAAGPQDWQERIMVQADLSTGAWMADFNTIGFDITEEMRPWSFAQIFDEDGDANEGSTPPSPLVPWRDEFDGWLREGWNWVNENPDKWNLVETPGFLRITTSHLGMGGENLLLRSVAPGDFSMETHVLFEPNSNFQFAGLVIYQDDQNDLAFGRAFCDTAGACVGNGIYFDYVADGAWVNGNFGTPVGSSNEAYLRLERQGDMVRASYSYEGITWFEIGTHWIPSDFQVNGVGLMTSGDYNTEDQDISADFDYFELAEG